MCLRRTGMLWRQSGLSTRSCRGACTQTYFLHLQFAYTPQISEYLDSIHLDKEINRDITVQFLTSATVGILEWWIIHSMPYPASIMVEQFWSLLNGAVEGHEHQSIGRKTLRFLVRPFYFLGTYWTAPHILFPYLMTW